MNSIYDRIKDMPNPSQGLLSLFRKNNSGSVWAYKDHYRVADFRTLKTIEKLPLHKLTLRLGSPSSFGNNLDLTKGHVQSRAFQGVNVKEYMFTGRKSGFVYLVGIGTKSKPVWMVDVTEKLIEGLNTVGACFISKSHCKFEEISINIKRCKFCGDKLRRKVVVEKRIEWNRDEE